jgi:hypothetical protein
MEANAKVAEIERLPSHPRSVARTERRAAFDGVHAVSWGAAAMDIHDGIRRSTLQAFELFEHFEDHCTCYTRRLHSVQTMFRAMLASHRTQYWIVREVLRGAQSRKKGYELVQTTANIHPACNSIISRCESSTAGAQS